MKKGMIVGAVIIALLLLFVVSAYNGLVQRDVGVDEAFGNLDAALQRRYDLIPNLVNTVKGYAEHEEGVFTEITELRSQWTKAASVSEKQALSGKLEGAIGRLLLVAENYPALKASENFLGLQDELAGTENRITVARTRYNEKVKSMNTKVRTFPSNIVANMFGFGKREFFEADEGAEEAVKVEF
ncbi:MAG: LemA family protein [Candidatus Nanoarchaeia archaeon]